jgi:beta-lactamase regulating signal transducer with metallopeptidase domain
MSPGMELIEHPLVQRLGWTLLHFVWQGTAIALVWGIARTLLQARSPRARYLVACLLMGSMAVAPILTFRLVDSSSVPAHVTITASGYEAESLMIPPPQSPDSPRVPMVQDLAKSAAAGLERALPWLVVSWWIGVCALSVRLLHGFWQVRRMASRLTRPLTAAWQERCRELQRRLRMSRPVLLLESAAIEIPAVVGWLRPVVLVPASSLSGLTPAQLELILAHELAHIRRHDH